MLDTSGLLPQEKIVVWDDHRQRVKQSPVTVAWFRKLPATGNTNRFIPIGKSTESFFRALENDRAMQIMQARDLLLSNEPEVEFSPEPEPEETAKPEIKKSEVARMNHDQLDEAVEALGAEFPEGWSGYSLTKKRNYVKENI